MFMTIFVFSEPPSVTKTILYFFIALIIPIPVAVTGFYSYSSKPEDFPLMDYGKIWFEETPIPPLIVGNIVS